MTQQKIPVIFGEVLFDCFSDDQCILGGAPFNVAWHLQAFQHQPCFITRVGEDELGAEIVNSMEQWGMDTKQVQRDKEHVTGRVNVIVENNEPSYDIAENSAYDFIDSSKINLPNSAAILYHGSLALRNKVSRQAYESLINHHELPIFMDVNLRSPHWQSEEVLNWVDKARWVKLNYDELLQLGAGTGNQEKDMAVFQEKHAIKELIVTRGEAGAIVRTENGKLYSAKPPQVTHLVDTVGAGDAFTSVYIHGILSDWPVIRTLELAQEFASAVVAQQGATTTDPKFYLPFNMA